MTKQTFYGDALPKLEAAERQLVSLCTQCPLSHELDGESPSVLSCISRIKSPDSMIAKLRGRGLAADCQAALTAVHDAVGVRVICAFADDVYRVAGWLAAQPDLRCIQVKDYIACPKPNGYRSYHMIVELAGGPGQGITAEIQLRTIAIDFWATLEHQMKYKRTIPHEALIRAELKRCADEIASVDLSMQTIRELLTQSF